MKTFHPPGSIWYNCSNNTTLMMGEDGEWKTIYPSKESQNLWSKPKENLWDKAARLFKKLAWKE